MSRVNNLVTTLALLGAAAVNDTSAMDANAATTSPPPIRAFTDYFDHEMVRINPAGTLIAATTRFRDDKGGALDVLHIQEIPSGKRTATVNFGKYGGVHDFRWVSNERVLVEMSQRSSKVDAETPTGELFALNADGRKQTMLFGPRVKRADLGTQIRRATSSFASAKVLFLVPDEPNQLLITSVPYRRHGRYTQALKVNLNSGRQRRLATSPSPFGSFIPGRDGTVLLATGVSRDFKFEIHQREPDGDWNRVGAFPYGTDDRWAPLWFGRSDDLFYSYDEDTGPTGGLGEFNIKTGEHRLLYRHERVSIGQPVFNPLTAELIAVRYVEDKPNYFYTSSEDAFAQLHQKLLAMFPGADVEITSATQDLNKAVLLVHGASLAGDFYLYEAPQTLTRLMSRAPKLANTQLAKVETHWLQARDGTPLLSYLYRPIRAAQTKPPFVVVVHDGPHGIHDEWKYDWQAQLLASRGFGVLQVNFRGSSGFGRAFEAAGHGQWGATMQDDVTDATRWLIHEGIADPKRICIYGGSYGGYAALMGAAREPDLYRCSIGYAGIYDLGEVLTSGDIPSTNNGVAYLRTVLGADEALLRQRSPVFRAHEIRAQVMLIHGARDRRAPLSHATAMRDALVAAGNPPLWHIEPDEAHGIHDEVNRAEMFAALLAFLDQQIGSGATIQ